MPIRRRELICGQQPLRGCLDGLDVFAFLSAPFPGAAELLHRGAKQVFPQTPFPHEFVERINQFLMAQALVADDLPDVSVVLLLDVSLVVLPIGARAGLVNALVLQVMIEVVIDEFAPAVAVDPAQGEGLGTADFLQSGKGGVLPTVPKAPDLRPAAEDFHAGQRPNKTPSHVATAMGDGVHFGPADLLGVPPLGTDFDEGFDRRVAAGNQTLPTDAHLGRGQQAVDRRGTHLQYSGARGRWPLAVRWQMRQPQGQHSDHPLATGLLHALPAVFEQRDLLRAVEPGGAPAPGTLATALLATQHLDRVLPAVAGHRAKFVEHTATASLSSHP